MSVLPAETPIEIARTTSNCACSHCSLPVPVGLFESGATEQFCCSGCRAVWNSLHEAGLAGYYELLEREGAAREQARVTGRGFEYLDSPAVTAAHTRKAGAQSECRLRIDGLHCGACVWLIESLPQVVPGLRSARVNLSLSQLDLGWESGRISLGQIARALDRFGYQISLIDDPASHARAQQAARRSVAMLGIAGGLSANAMGLAFTQYGALVGPMDPSLRLFLQWWSVSLAVLAVAWPGRCFFVNALAAMRARVGHMDIPVAVGLAAGTAAGIVATIRGTGAIYCEGVTMLVFLLLVGRHVQRLQQQRALRQIESLFAIIPATARRIASDGPPRVACEVGASELLPGDRIEVPAHEVVAADGILESESGEFDRAHLTGESRPVLRRRGDLIEAGSRAVGTAVVIEVQRIGEQTRAGQILALVRAAASRRAPICLLADRIALWFLLGVVLLAAATAAFWWPSLGADVAIERTVAVLVVTCPCALGLATPLAMLSGLGSAARSGILIKGADILERLAVPGTVVLDKTGTLTQGQPSIIQLHADSQLVSLAATLEQSTVHPIGRVIAARGASGAIVTERLEIPGEGVTGCVDGRRMAVGNARLMERVGMPLDASVYARLDECAHRGSTAVLIGWGGRASVLAEVGDQLRPEAAATIAELRRRGWQIRLASGDEAGAAQHIGRLAGLRREEILSGLDPEQKLSLVRSAELARPVVMIGDGINDLPAFAGSDCGVAVRGAAQSAIATADACLAGDGLSGLQRLLGTARATMGTVHLNLLISVLYNAGGAAAAFFGLVNPIVASILMPLSGLTVLATSLKWARVPTDKSGGLI